MSDQIHIGDVGTIYSVPVLDDFDVTQATLNELIWYLPRSIVVRREATIVEDTDGTFLEYQVTPEDVLGSPPDEFHAHPGQFFMQAYTEFPDGQTYHSNVVTVDDDDQELRIFPNIGA